MAGNVFEKFFFIFTFLSTKENISEVILNNQRQKASCGTLNQTATDKHTYSYVCLDCATYKFRIHLFYLILGVYIFAFAYAKSFLIAFLIFLLLFFVLLDVSEADCKNLVLLMALKKFVQKLFLELLLATCVAHGKPCAI